MKLSKQQLADIFDDAADFDGSNEQAVYARKALLAGTLEIEGYIRADHFADAGKMGWTKFDPNDPKTFPPKGKFLYFDGFGIAIGIHLQCERKDGFVHVYRKITHWRPLPKSPQTEVGK